MPFKMSLMPFKRLTVTTLFAVVCIICNGSVFARSANLLPALVCDAETRQGPLLPLLSTSFWNFAQNADPVEIPLDTSGAFAKIHEVKIALAEQAPRRMLADFALQLRNIRYHRGGREPSTGFDCSGFVHYVFLHTMGLDLPNDAPGQFVIGQKVARTQMQMGDLVFFGTRGTGISHVGIYLEDGRFIHSPSPGKMVRIDHLENVYWTKRFVGARRLDSFS